MTTRAAAFLIAIAVIAGPHAALSAQTPSLSLPEAMDKLEEARYQMETCAGVVKAFADARNRNLAELNYRDAQANVNGLLTGLAASAKQCSGAVTLKGLEPRLVRLEKQRAEVCAMAKAARETSPGERGVIDAVIGAAGEALGIAITAIKDLIIDDRDKERCQNIETMVEAKRWGDFADIKEVRE